MFGHQAAVITAWPGDPVPRVQAFPSFPADLNQNLPRTDKAVLAAAGLSPDSTACAVAGPIVAVPPQMVEMGSAEMSSAAILQYPPPMSFSAPSLPSSSDISSLQQEAYRLPESTNDPLYSAPIAHLRPSLPAPWSLVTWAPSLTISGAACKPSNIYNPAQLDVTADHGRVEGIPPWSPGQRGYRLLPSLPSPGGILIPEAPAQARAQLIPLTASRPDSQGTASPDLIRIRVHATPMSVLAVNFEKPAIKEEIGLQLSGRFFEDSLKVASVDSALESFQISSEVAAESNTVLPAFSPNRYSPVLGVASSNESAWGGPVPPNRPLRPVAPFSALNRVAGSVAAF
jgi:hypothetical protein